MENDKEKNSDSMFDELSSSESSSMFDSNTDTQNPASMFENNTAENKKDAISESLSENKDAPKEDIKQDIKPEKEKTEEPIVEDKAVKATDNEESSPSIEEKENKVQNKEEDESPNLIIESEDEDIENSSSLVTVRPVKFKEFDAIPPNHVVKKNYDIMLDIPLHISVELGRTKSTIKDVIDLTKGSIVELNKIAGEQVEIYVNDKFVAKGEVIVIEDRFGVRVTNTNIQKSTLTL